MIFSVTILAISVLLYVLLEGFDLGVGILSRLSRNKTRRTAMMDAVTPVWDGNETGSSSPASRCGGFAIVDATLFSALYLALLLMLADPILTGVATRRKPR